MSQLRGLPLEKAELYGKPHGGARYEARWVWDGPQYERWWWDGILLEKFGPHAPELYAFGRWEIYDRRAGRSFEIREGDIDGVRQL